MSGFCKLNFAAFSFHAGMSSNITFHYFLYSFVCQFILMTSHNVLNIVKISRQMKKSCGSAYSTYQTFLKEKKEK